VPGAAGVLVGPSSIPVLGLALAVGLGGREARLGQTIAFRLALEADTRGPSS